MRWMPLSAEKFENVSEVNAVSSSETNICGIPKQVKICFNFRIVSSAVMNSFICEYFGPFCMMEMHHFLKHMTESCGFMDYYRSDW